MPSYMLKQPDGLIAIFSSVVDDFTHMNMSEEQALAVGTQEWGERTAREKLGRALADESVWPGDADFVSDGLGRWREACGDIAFQHGVKHLRTMLDDMECNDFEIPECAKERARDMEEMLQEDGVSIANRY
ncbi:hypothetical protein D3C71_156670 [compost metagenome]